MAQLTTDDLKELPGLYDSPRNVGDVLVGEDAARLLIEASSSGNNTALQSLLSQPQWIKTILETPHSIYYEERPSEGPNDVRQVMAARTSNLERALNAAAGNGQAAAVSTLLAFATQQGMTASDVITRLTINKTINGGHAAVYKALASADPNVINFPHLGHGTLPLYEAVRRRQPDVAAVLLELGADPLHPVAQSKKLGSYHSSLLSFAAFCEGPRMTELLLERGVPVAGTGALHTAARWGHLDTMRRLMEHGADLDEVLPSFLHWTPMHFAASKSEVDAMKLLEDSGARSDLEDENGKTPAQLLEERNAAIAREGGPGKGSFWPWVT
ncbi:ankyrin repeat-containing domain protein [Diaporthe sp. PMI_573]|nr:ankyrin repeat-containing domain protein [Diaporthaceae sp. PMI_573]